MRRSTIGILPALGGGILGFLVWAAIGPDPREPDEPWRAHNEGGGPTGRHRPLEARVADISEVLASLETEGLIGFAREVSTSETALPALNADKDLKHKAAYPVDEVIRFHQLLLAELNREVALLASLDVSSFDDHVDHLSALTERMSEAGGYRNLISATVLQKHLAVALLVRSVSEHEVSERTLLLARRLSDQRTTAQDVRLQLQRDFGDRFTIRSGSESGGDEGKLLMMLYRLVEDTSGAQQSESDDPLGAIHPAAEPFDVFWNENKQNGHLLISFDLGAILGALGLLQAEIEAAVGLLEIREALGIVPTEREDIDRAVGKHVTSVREGRILLMTGDALDAELYRDTARQARRDDYAEIHLR